uniref:Kazal-like domain-containing protein n=1 Tax=Taeniopygia guttata TaxID=59729 RepID=A0A674HK65_TAEGU
GDVQGLYFLICASLSAYPCQPMLLAFAQDECQEFRDLFKRGKLSCTRENDPVRDASGKQHSNKCIIVGKLSSLEHPGKCVKKCEKP